MSNTVEQYGDVAPVETAGFFVEELKRAVNEHRDRLHNVGNVQASMVAGMPGADVEVETLERVPLRIELTLAGFRTLDPSGAAQGQYFETIDHLLEQESPMWSSGRMQDLMSKLESIER